jgi:putative transposase
MSSYVRPKLSGTSVFCTVCLADRGTDLLTRHVDRLRAAVAAMLLDRPLEVKAWVVLPDHMHFVWTLPEADGGYAVRIGAMKARFTRSMREVGWNPTLRRSPSKVRSGDAGLWQRRFWEHTIRDDADLAAHVRYCWGNPVRHGLATRPIDWPYSSIHRDIREGRVEPLWSGQCPEGVFGE